MNSPRFSPVCCLQFSQYAARRFLRVQRERATNCELLAPVSSGIRNKFVVYSGYTLFYYKY